MNEQSNIDLQIVINHLIKNGIKRTEIVKQLSSEKIDSESINSMIDVAIKLQAIAKEMEEDRQAVASFKLFFIPILMFILLNALIYAGQEIYYWEDVKKCESIEGKIKNIKIQIEDIDNIIKLRTSSLNEINKLEIKIKNGYSNDYKKYEQMVGKFNSTSVSYKKNLKQYDTLINNYNTNIVEYNQLAKHAYARWWLIPIPLPSKHVNF